MYKSHFLNISAKKFLYKNPFILLNKNTANSFLISKLLNMMYKSQTNVLFFDKENDQEKNYSYITAFDLINFHHLNPFSNCLSDIDNNNIIKPLKTFDNELFKFENENTLTMLNILKNPPKNDQSIFFFPLN